MEVSSEHHVDYKRLTRPDAWRRQRRYVHSMLTTAHQQGYYGIIQAETKHFLNTLLLDPFSYYEAIPALTGRIASTLTYGWPDASTFLANNAFEFIGQSCVKSYAMASL